MSLPKHYQQTVNLNKRIEALNDLTFYFFKYEVELTNKIVNEFVDNSRNFDDLEKFLGQINFMGNKKAICKNRVSAVTEDLAFKKIEEWLGKATESEIIKEYKILEVTKKTFVEELEDKKLSDILNFKRD